MPSCVLSTSLLHHMRKARLLHSLLEPAVELEAPEQRLRVGAQIGRVAHGLRRNAIKRAERHAPGLHVYRQISCSDA